MNRASFMDELLKIASGDIWKRAYEGSGAVPEGLMSSDPVPPEIDVHPSRAETRLPNTAHLPSVIDEGALGDVTQAKSPIDQHKYNRVYRDRR